MIAGGWIWWLPLPWEWRIALSARARIPVVSLLGCRSVSRAEPAHGLDHLVEASLGGPKAKSGGTGFRPGSSVSDRTPGGVFSRPFGRYNWFQADGVMKGPRPGACG
ncbi:MAG: hypothetical protein K0Q46_938 [Rhodococcus erythropolis]|jgi:hypothetical protein|nr:hypothetical protein [Rhodococcus erythropolis]